MPPSIPFARLGLSSLRPLQKPTISSQQLRAFASVLPTTPTPSASSAVTKAKSKLPGNVPDARKEGALRPHLGVEVDPDHGLWAFFRRKTAEDGTTKYETVEPLDFAGLQTGRAWTAAELRRKSFKDLHTLWYVLVRERNLLATQREEARRMGIMHNRLDSATKVFRVRKSMARIKYVLNERRLAYEGAIEIHENKAKEVQSKREERRQRTKEAIARAKERKEQKEKAELAAQAEPTDEAAKLAVAGVLQQEPEPVVQNTQS